MDTSVQIKETSENNFITEKILLNRISKECRRISGKYMTREEIVCLFYSSTEAKIFLLKDLRAVNKHDFTYKQLIENINRFLKNFSRGE